jgi:crossover junction endodeoxyribonuclease RuvC
MKQFNETRVLAFDPGRQTGFSVIRIEKINQDLLQPCYIKSGVIRDNKKLDFDSQLVNLANEINNLIVNVKPFAIALEGGIPFKSHKRSLERLGQIRGVIKALATLNDLWWYEMKPSEIKKLITGKGNSCKELVALKALEKLGINKNLTTDESDAIAIGITFVSNLDPATI